MTENSLVYSKRWSANYRDHYDTSWTSDFIDFYKIRGDANARRLFEFLANYTRVEWSWWATGLEGDKGVNFISTSGLPHTEYSGVHLFIGMLQYGFNLRFHVHNHPTSPIPSGLGEGGEGDIGFRNSLVAYVQAVYPERYGFLPRIKFAVYTPYYVFSKEHGIWTRYLYYHDINDKIDLYEKYIIPRR